MIRLVPILLFPVAELWALLELGDALGTWSVVLWCIATAVLGLALVRRQASAVGEFVRTAQADMRQGIRPSAFEPSGHALWAFAGVLFAFPGVISDVIAVALLVRGYLRRPRSAKAPASAPKAGKRSPGGVTLDVEVLPPGRVQSPFQKERPKVIDID